MDQSLSRFYVVSVPFPAVRLQGGNVSEQVTPQVGAAPPGMDAEVKKEADGEGFLGVGIDDDAAPAPLLSDEVRMFFL